jgi:hypothetical protein
VRQRERVDGETEGQGRDDTLQPDAWWDERRREPVEQVREEHEELDVEPLRDVLERAVRVRRSEPAHGDEQRDRDERERQPGSRRVAPAPPPPRRARGQQDEQDGVRDADGDDERVQDAPRVVAPPNPTLMAILGLSVTIRP